MAIISIVLFTFFGIEVEALVFNFIIANGDNNDIVDIYNSVGIISVVDNVGEGVGTPHHY